MFFLIQFNYQLHWKHFNYFSITLKVLHISGQRGPPKPIQCQQCVGGGHCHFGTRVSEEQWDAGISVFQLLCAGHLGWHWQCRLCQLEGRCRFISRLDSYLFGFEQRRWITWKVWVNLCIYYIIFLKNHVFFLPLGLKEKLMDTKFLEHLNF